jgi:dihydrofolate reductase
MRKVVLNLAVSLDGYIAGPNGEYDWCFVDDDYGMTDFLKSVDATLMGGKSYRLVTSDGDPYPEFTNYVFTRTETKTPYENVVLVSEDIPEFVRRMKQKKGKNIWLFGGSEIIHPLIQENLVDEMILSIHPILLGGGVPLFKDLDERKTFHLSDTITYPTGLVQLIYKIM